MSLTKAYIMPHTNVNLYSHVKTSSNHISLEENSNFESDIEQHRKNTNKLLYKSKNNNLEPIHSIHDVKLKRK